jgi:hypothetical protein
VGSKSQAPIWFERKVEFPFPAFIIYLLFSKRNCGILPVGNQKGGAMEQKADVLQGTLGLFAVKAEDMS